MNSTTEQTGDISIPRLRSVIRGEVIVAADAEYDRARAVYLTGIDRRPVAIMRPIDADDVARVVLLAAETGLPLAVRSGGHSVAGHGVSDGGLVIDLSAMRALDIDVGGRTAWAETGLTAGEYTRGVGAHGLATGFGDSPSVGIGGITLGGGVGFLHRRHGLTIDNLLAADIVTADGRLLRADADTHPDLFWAVRGGGGNFGVATRFQYRLREIEAVLGGPLILPATPAVVASFLAEAAAAPDALSGMINIMIAPPMPFLPAEVHGTPILMAVMVHDGDGDSAAGERAFAPFRAIATPIADHVQPIRYAQVYDGPEPPKLATMTVRSLFVEGVEVDAAEGILDGLRRSPAPLGIAQFRVLGGAVARVPAEATAFAHRGRRMMATIAAGAFEGAGDHAAHAAWADELAGLLVDGGPGTYVGFLGEEDPARVREAYAGPTWDRLRAIKAKYDPTNLFRLNQNVPPAEG